MMTPDQPNETRPQVHFRQLALVVCFFALFLGVLTPLARQLGARGIVNPPLVLLVLAPWLLGVLILLFERKSPLKFWAAPLLLSLVAPALAIVHNWAVLESWFRTQTMPNLLGTLAINIALIGTFTAFATSMCPNRCPECRHLAMIPLRGFWGVARRTPTTRWCSSCGARYWRTYEGEWRKERRRTWLDESRQVLEQGFKDRGSRFDPGSRVVAPMISSANLKPFTAMPASSVREDLAGGARE